MLAASVVRLDGPAAVQVGPVPDPVPHGNEVLVAVEAAGAVYPDVLLSRGRYQTIPSLPFVLGSQVTGTVVEAPGAASCSVGDRVCGVTAIGGFAELVAIDADRVVSAPANLDWISSAACLANYITADFVLRLRAGLVAGETVLVHGAGGGVGLASVQLATALGARVIAAVSTPEKAEAARVSGATDTIPVDDFRSAIRELTKGRGVDVVVDPVGGERFTDSLRCLAPAGRLVVVGFTGGSIPEVRVNRLLLNNISVVGAALGEYLRGHPGLLRTQWAELLPRFVSGALTPVIGEVFGLRDVPEALRRLEDREAVGNLVVRVRTGSAAA